MVILDFGKPNLGIAGQFDMFAIVNRTKEFAFIPQQLELKPRQNNPTLPEFSLELVRGAAPFLPPKPYGLLEIGLRGMDYGEAALKKVRESVSKGIVQPARLNNGWLRLIEVATQELLDETFLTPQRVGWSGLGEGHLAQRLSIAAALQLKGTLKNELLTIRAALETEVQGWSPRLPVKVSFEIETLLGALLASANSRRELPWQTLKKRLQTDDLFEVESAVAIDPADIADVLTDYVRAKFGHFALADQDDLRPTMRLRNNDIPDGNIQLDLSKPFITQRVLILQLDLATALKGIITNEQEHSLITETTVPPFQTGIKEFSIKANLPEEINDIIAIGVNLTAPPKPPERVHALVTSELLTPPKYQTTVKWRLAANEELAYVVNTFVVIKVDSGVRELKGETRTETVADLSLSVDRFPVDFIQLTATPQLLAEATIEIVLNWDNIGQTGTQYITLNQDKTESTIIVPKNADGELKVTAVALDGITKATLTQTLSSQKFAHFSFAEYGPHSVEITCRLSEQQDFYALEVQSLSNPEESTLITFTPDKPTQTYRWFASSPFSAGYRFRPYQTSGNEPFPWSEAQLPFVALKLFISPEGTIKNIEIKLSS